MDNDEINEGKEVLNPTFEIAGNPMWSRDGKFIGNYVEEDGFVKHFSAESFFLWMIKAGLDDYDVVVCPGGLFAEFLFGNKPHKLPNHLICELTWDEIERLKEGLDYYDNFGIVISRLFDALDKGRRSTT